MTKAPSTAIRRVQVSGESVQHRAGGHVHKTNVRVEAGHQQCLRVLGWHDGSDRF